MADEASSSITIAAAPQQVLDVISDIERYPEWTAQIKQVEVLEKGPAGRPAQVRFVLDAGMLRDEYVLAYSWRPDGVDWKLVAPSGMQKAQTGSYTLAGAGESTEVTYRLTVDLAMPMLGMFKRKAEKMIMDSALKELKKRVESAS